MMKRFFSMGVVFLMVIGFAVAGFAAADANDGSDDASKMKVSLNLDDPSKAVGWISLFDGETLDGWEMRRVGDEGRVTLDDGCMRLGAGGTLTSVTYRGDVSLPTADYELELEAMRLDGSDFFATTTFPVGDEFCSFVVGGWGGGLVGISSVDRMDASENITSSWRTFSNNQWYRIRIQVSNRRIRTWIDGKSCIDFPIEHHRLSTRFEVKCCEPLGIGTWCTSAKIRSVRIRHILPDGRPINTPRFLFDGRSLEGWHVADTGDFTGHAIVEVVAAVEPENSDRLQKTPAPEVSGELHLGEGGPMTGVRCDGEPLPWTNYELLFDAKRVTGNDFFAGLTFPIGDEFATLILGGWGGRVCGLSNVDGHPAAANLTTTPVVFENGVWYHVLLRVSDDRIEVFVDREPDVDVAKKPGMASKSDLSGRGNTDQDDADDEESDGPEPLIRCARSGHHFSIWPEQMPMRPLGFASWNTHGAIRNVRIRTF